MVVERKVQTSNKLCSVPWLGEIYVFVYFWYIHPIVYRQQILGTQRTKRENPDGNDLWLAEGEFTGLFSVKCQ